MEQSLKLKVPCCTLHGMTCVYDGVSTAGLMHDV